MTVKAYIILSFLFILIVGLISLLLHLRRLVELYRFALTYRNKFIEFTNKYAASDNRYSGGRDFDYDSYVWLIKNADQIQSDLGHLGVMNYIAPFRAFQVPNYQIILNTLPRFREGKITDFDVNACDDCMLRYIGLLENIIERTKNRIRNPLIWFKEGFQQLFNLPFYLLNWFGVLSDKATSKVTGNAFYQLISGISALITLVSGLVTIIQGKDQALEWIKKLWHH